MPPLALYVFHTVDHITYSCPLQCSPHVADTSWESCGGETRQINASFGNQTAAKLKFPALTFPNMFHTTGHFLSIQTPRLLTRLLPFPLCLRKQVNQAQKPVGC